MSKSLGNSPDPIELMEKYGADGVRMGMLLTAPAGNDLPFDEAICEQGRNFANKIWNAMRLVRGWQTSNELNQSTDNATAVQWMEQRLACVLEEVEHDFDNYRLSEALMSVYKLVWDDFCSWYLEMVKPAYGSPIDSETYDSTIGIFEKLMCMLHPFMPFLTEEVWHTLRERPAGSSIMVQHYPLSVFYDNRMLDAFTMARDVITGVRGLRNSKGISPKETLQLFVIESGNSHIENNFDGIICKLANVESINRVNEKIDGALSFMVGTMECFVPMSQNLDVEAERNKLMEELKYTEGFLSSVMKKLSNDRFVNGAPEKVVAVERQKKADAEQKIASIKAQIESLGK